MGPEAKTTGESTSDVAKDSMSGCTHVEGAYSDSDTKVSRTSLSDFTNAVEKLESSGSNWVIFHKRFKIAVKQKKVWGHFDGTSIKPEKPVVTGKSSVDEMAAYKRRLNAWEEREDLAMYLLTQKLPDSTFTKYMRKETVAEMWETISQEFTEKSMLMRSYLHSEFMAMRYEKGADLRAEFDRRLAKTIIARS
ncbi:hypothetical protein M378DRAFT_18300 [Amanita muscaria Koide BX008]|uniref:Uncharacterized protein n=1 Tax=Amanita muscaria (strain Koide BX008) TaxID=946122 RepID=A0A0C2RXL5_AMAMK|nr:hypothetical protein M378DRAFT_18300 [Amanita muscaria Koide BX008]